MTQAGTEKELMLAGEPYRSRDPELLSMYHRARRLLAAFSATPSTDAAGKQELLSELLGHLGREVWIEAPFFCDYGENITIGNNVFINYNCVFLDCNRIHVGDDALIGPAVQVYTATHPIEASKRIHRAPEGESGTSHYETRALPVTIGSRTWIGGGDIIMPGTTIGDDTTIGAGSVVTRSIPPRCVAAGNPCRVIREIT